MQLLKGTVNFEIETATLHDTSLAVAKIPFHVEGLIVSGLEKEFDQRLMPDGRVNIDGFLVVFDVSLVPNRTLEKQVVTTKIFFNKDLTNIFPG